MALAAIGPPANDAAEDIKRVLETDSSNDVQRAAALPPAGLEPTLARPTAGALEKTAFVDRPPAGSDQCLGPHPRDARQCCAVSKQLVSVLIEGLKHPRHSTRMQAADGLGTLGAKASDAQAALRAAVSDEDEQVRTAASQALEKVMP